MQLNIYCGLGANGANLIEGDLIGKQFRLVTGHAGWLRIRSFIWRGIKCTK